VCILFVNDENVTMDEQSAISEQLVRSGCRSAVCAGHKSSSWDDSVDWAYLDRVNYEPNDETLVMTVWHEQESVEDVVFSGLMCSDFDEHEFHRYLVLFVGPNPGLWMMFKKAFVLFGVEICWSKALTHKRGFERKCSSAHSLR